ncbi:MAG: hypothetical protein JW947_00165 [Sedimentisphaerales bacterium]|nr:hypothetical protein [Sedimentisphaerales bacterium]
MKEVKLSREKLRVFLGFIIALIVCIPVLGPASPQAAEKAREDVNSLVPCQLKLDRPGRVNIGTQGNSLTTAGWETVFSDGFESSWPGPWSVTDQDSSNGSDYWGRLTCKPGGAHSGSYSVWCAAEGDMTDCGSSYDNYMQSWMVYGPFSLSDCTDGEVDFYFVNECESGYDAFYFVISINGVNFYGYYHTGTTSSYPNTWQHYTFDLTSVPTLGNVCGQSNVYFAFVFSSDNVINSYRGAYIDDVAIRRYVEPPPTGEIHGSKWNDLDGDGVRDRGEAGLPDWKIYIDENTNGQWDSGEPCDLTDPNGDYSFTDLSAGTYYIGEIQQEGWEQTYPTGAVLAAAMQSGPTTYGDLLSSEELANIERIDMDSPPTPPAGVEMTAVKSVSTSAVMLSGVPTSTWTYGCSATSAGMLFGYYDRTGYPNMYTGPTNGGVAPLTDLGQGIGTPIPGSCSIIATQNGFDGRTSNGHVDDYWIYYLEPGPDPWEGNRPEHTWGDCTADYMGTNQWKWDFPCDGGGASSNVDGSTTLFTAGASRLYDYIPPSCAGMPQTELCHGMRLFTESRGYTVLENYSQAISGFTFNDYMAEIDAGYPVLIHLAGHSTIGVGYDSATQTVYIHDTWDNSVHSMTWGGSYAEMNHIAVTVIHLAPNLSNVHRVELGAGEIVSDIDFGNQGPYRYFGSFSSQKNVKLTLEDCNSNDVTFTLTGAGYGMIGRDDCNFSNITLNDTTEKSVFTIKTKSKIETSVGSVIVNGPLKGITAKTADLRGDVMVSGSLGSLTFDDIADGCSITIGPSANPKNGVLMKFDQVEGLSLNSQMPIKTLTAAEWLGGEVNAPSISSLTIIGDKKRGISGDLFDVDLFLTQKPDKKISALGSLTVKGWIDSCQILSQGKIGSITAAAVADSSFFAGVNDTNDLNGDGVLDLPDPAADINYTDPAEIKSFKVNGIKGETYCVINSNIAAAQVLSASLAYPKYDNGGVVFGIAADYIKILKIKDVNRIPPLRKLDDPTQNYKKDDFEVNLH